MKVRILNTPGSVAIEYDRFSKWLLKNFQIEAEFEQVTTTVPHTEEPLNNPRWPGRVKLGNGYSYYDKFKSGCDMLVINWKPSSGDWNNPTSTSNTWYLYNVYILEVGCYLTDDFYRQLTHESIHGFWYRLMEDFKKPRVDTMDLYDYEYDVDSPYGNRARNIAALQPYLSLLDPSAPRKAKLQAMIDALRAKLASLQDHSAPGEVVAPAGITAIRRTFGDPLAPDFEAKNIVSFKLPYPLLYGGQPVTTGRCHKLVVPNMINALAEVKKAGLEAYVRNYGGIYNLRSKRTAEQLSTHSWGIAIDIEPAKYPLGTHDRLPKRVVDIFKRHGFVCGEDFPTSDPGHMQLASGY